MVNSNAVSAQNSDDQLAEVFKAFEQTVEAEKIQLPQFKTIFDWIIKDAGNEAWRKIRWRRDLWAARKESAELNKPLFIWAMNGDPLGCV